VNFIHVPASGANQSRVDERALNWGTSLKKRSGYF
jgi:hypothetical protein